MIGTESGARYYDAEPRPAVPSDSIDNPNKELHASRLATTAEIQHANPW